LLDVVPAAQQPLQRTVMDKVQGTKGSAPPLNRGVRRTGDGQHPGSRKPTDKRHRTARLQKAMKICRTMVLLLMTVLAWWSCGGSATTPSATPSTAPQLPLALETLSMRYFHEPADTIDVPRQEAFNAWAVERIAVVVPQKVEYRKYLSRDAMAKYTGRDNTNGFAEPELFRFHMIRPYENHEVVHVYTALVGRPSDFFNEGIAVSFQTDPSRNDFSVVFNGLEVHEACRGYLRAGTLPLPISRYVTTNEFRTIPDQVLSYRVAGSFVLFLEERFGLSRVLSFFQVSGRDDPLDTVQARFQQTFRVTLEEAEAAWVGILQ
jgi:hypothetical protein